MIVKFSRSGSAHPMRYYGGLRDRKGDLRERKAEFILGDPVEFHRHTLGRETRPAYDSFSLKDFTPGSEAILRSTKFQEALRDLFLPGLPWRILPHLLCLHGFLDGHMDAHLLLHRRFPHNDRETKIHIPSDQRFLHLGSSWLSRQFALSDPRASEHAVLVPQSHVGVSDEKRAIHDDFVGYAAQTALSREYLDFNALKEHLFTKYPNLHHTRNGFILEHVGSVIRVRSSLLTPDGFDRCLARTNRNPDQKGNRIVESNEERILRITKDDRLFAKLRQRRSKRIAAAFHLNRVQEVAPISHPGAVRRDLVDPADRIHPDRIRDGSGPGLDALPHLDVTPAQNEIQRRVQETYPSIGRKRSNHPVADPCDRFHDSVHRVAQEVHDRLRDLAGPFGFDAAKHPEHGIGDPGPSEPPQVEKSHEAENHSTTPEAEMGGMEPW
jgi:hypothetical protein